MAELFGRVCSVTVGDRTYEGLRVQFKVSRSTRGKPNQAEIQITNLDPDSRQRVRVSGLPVRLVAGYTGASALLLTGELWDARDKRDGTEVITIIRANDGDTAFRRQVRKSWAAGTKRRDVVHALAEAMGLGVIERSLDLIEGVYQSPRVVSGPAALALDRIALSTGLEWSIQDGQLVLVPADGTTYETAVVLEPGTGLEGSPELQERQKAKKGKPATTGMVKAVSRLNPLLRPGRAVKLDSASVAGKYRCDVVDHDGDTHDEQRWTSTCTLRPVR